MHSKLKPYISPCNTHEVQCNLPHVGVGVGYDQLADMLGEIW